MLVLAAAIVMLVPQSASAHEVRPAYLSVQEEAPNEFSVLFKTPMQGDARLALSALVLRQDRDGDAGRLASDRRCDGADLAHAHAGAAGRPEQC